MLKRNIYIGTINIKEDNKINTYQTTNPLLYIGNRKYINLEWIKTIKDRLSLYKGMLTGNYKKEWILQDIEPDSGIYVDIDSLTYYYEGIYDESININRVLEDIVLDSRIPRGIDILEDGTTVQYIRKPNPRLNK